MRNRSIDKLEPGFYLVQGFNSFFIEKDAEGNVHQLTFAGARDGILDGDEWNYDSELNIIPVWEPKR